MTPLGLVGAGVGAVVLSLLGAALLGSGSVAVLVILLGAAAIIALAVWTAPAQGAQRSKYGGEGYSAGGSGGGWGGDAGCGDGGGGGC